MDSEDLGDTLNGLAFGKKIYFEDVGSGSSSRVLPAEAPAPARKGKGVVQGAQPPPPRCQVEGCNVDLTGAKAYYCRHKVCGVHSKSPKVVVAGQEQRFCQQCSRFHQLSEFDQGKRSCRRRLAGHNERRRKPPPGPLSRYGRLASSFYEEDNLRYRSFLMDFTHPRPPGSRDIQTARSGDHAVANPWHRNMDVSHGAVPVHAAHLYMQSPAASADIPPGHCVAGVSDSSCALSLLSIPPWDATASRNRAPPLPVSNQFDFSPLAQPTVSSYMNNTWGFKGHTASSSSHEIQHHMELGHSMDDINCQFSGELELALQGNRQYPDLGPARAYDHSGQGMHWSL